MSRSLLTDERGLTTIEYVLVICLIAVVGFAAFDAVGDTVSSSSSDANDVLAGLSDGIVVGDGPGSTDGAGGRATGALTDGPGSAASPSSDGDFTGSSSPGFSGGDGPGSSGGGFVGDSGGGYVASADSDSISGSVVDGPTEGGRSEGSGASGSWDDADSGDGSGAAQAALTDAEQESWGFTDYAAYGGGAVSGLVSSQWDEVTSTGGEVLSNVWFRVRHPIQSVQNDWQTAKRAGAASWHAVNNPRETARRVQAAASEAATGARESWNRQVEGLGTGSPYERGQALGQMASTAVNVVSPVRKVRAANALGGRRDREDDDRDDDEREQGDRDDDDREDGTREDDREDDGLARPRRPEDPEELADHILDADRRGSGLSDDAHHRSASFATREQLARGEVFHPPQGDGVDRLLLQTRGRVNDQDGIFEYIIDPDGVVTHQRFIPRGVINGVPNQRPPRIN